MAYHTFTLNNYMRRCRKRYPTKIEYMESELVQKIHPTSLQWGGAKMMPPGFTASTPSDTPSPPSRPPSASLVSIGEDFIEGEGGEYLEELTSCVSPATRHDVMKLLRRRAVYARLSVSAGLVPPQTAFLMAAKTYKATIGEALLTEGCSRRLRDYVRRVVRKIVDVALLSERAFDENANQTRLVIPRQPLVRHSGRSEARRGPKKEIGTKDVLHRYLKKPIQQDTRKPSKTGSNPSPAKSRPVLGRSRIENATPASGSTASTARGQQADHKVDDPHGCLESTPVVIVYPSIP